MGVAILDDRVDAAHEIAVGPRHVGHFQRVQDRLVVLVHQHRDRLPGRAVQRFQELTETSGNRGVVRREAGAALDGGQLLRQPRLHLPRFAEVAAAEAQMHHRVANGPVPPVVDVEPSEQRLVPLEQFLQRVQEQALAEAPRAGEKVVRPLREQCVHMGGLVHVVAVPLPERAERLNADGQSASGHRGAASCGVERRRSCGPQQSVTAAVLPDPVGTIRTCGHSPVAGATCHASGCRSAPSASR